VEQVAKILQLNQESPEIQARVLVILNNYYQQPILLNQEIINLSRGDEGYPEPIVIEQGNISLICPLPLIVFSEKPMTLYIF